MEQVDQEALVTELETRVDRLRSLYDQYFMGIEKIEPGVPRKDVERRIQILRKEQIRNTGLRFRFQMLLQRYNTYQTYWQRICREIENGTYKRHMMRAQARFASDKQTAARRKSLPPAAVGADDESLDFDTIPPPASNDAAILEDADFAAFDELESLERRPAKRKIDVALDFGALDDPLDRAPSSMLIPAARPAPATPAPPRDARPSPLPPSSTGRVWRKANPAEPRFVGAPPSVPLPPVSVPPRSASSPPRAPAAVPPRPPPPLPPRTAVAPPRPAVPAAPSSGAERAAPPAPTAPRPSPPAAKPAPPAPPAAKPAPPAPLAAKPAPPAAKPAPPAPPAPPAKPAPPPRSAGGSDLPDERVRQLYSQYVETKRRQNESTAAITYDGLAKSLRESSAKLREKHGRAVDFEVAVKDGKTILKPVVK